MAVHFCVRQVGERQTLKQRMAGRWGCVARVLAGSAVVLLAWGAAAWAAPAGVDGGDKPHAHWEYAGSHGPAAWGDLSPAFAACKKGSQQSPIDIDQVETDAHLPELEWRYGAVPLRVQHNGHTLLVPVPSGQKLVWGSQTYELQQLHFHDPSEHTWNGVHAPMELHFVHKSSGGGVLVVAVMLRVAPVGAASTAADAAIGRVWEHAPPPLVMATTVEAFDLNALLPATRAYVAYEGSLTTPPCTEGVQWLVLLDALKVAAERVEAFARLMGPDARPVQPHTKRHLKLHAF